MEIDLFKLLNDKFGLLVFFVIGVGYLAGKLKVRGFALGPTAGVLLAGLFFGHFGLKSHQDLLELGFVLFVYSVGLQAGPRLVNIFFEQGKHYLAITSGVCLTALAGTWAATALLGLQTPLAFGMLAGSVTSSPTLAALQNTLTSHLAPVPEGFGLAEAVKAMSQGYAITYLFGMMGTLAAIKLLPRLLRADLQEEEARLARSDRRAPGGSRPSDEPVNHIVQAYLVNNPDLTGDTLKELAFYKRFGAVVHNVKRSGALSTADRNTVLNLGDMVSVLGPVESHEVLEREIGPKVLDKELLSLRMNSDTFTVMTPSAVGCLLSDLDLRTRHGCVPTRLIRAHVELPIRGDVVLEKGDVLTVSGPEDRLDALDRYIGPQERRRMRTDLLTFAFGIALGLFLGCVRIEFGGLSLGVGAAGGLLISGILIGFTRSMHPTFGQVPEAARLGFMDLGLMLFMACIGLDAGGSILATLKLEGFRLLACGAGTTLASLAVGFFIGKVVLGMNLLVLLGALSGAMNNTPALNVISEFSESRLPGLGYAGTYTFSNILLPFLGTILFSILR